MNAANHSGARFSELIKKKCRDDFRLLPVFITYKKKTSFLLDWLADFV